MSKAKPTSEPVEAKTVEAIKKPGPVDLDRFRSKRPATVSGVETLKTDLSVHSIAQAEDLVRLHPDEDAYWSYELCFVNVPIKGQSVISST